MDQIALQSEKLCKSFGALKAVDNLDLTIYRGECFGLLGPNGAGKTTTVEMLEGITDPDSGDIKVLGKSGVKDPETRQSLGIQLQETHFPGKLRVAEVLALYRSFYREGFTVDQLLDRIELQEKRAAFVETLSGGQKQRLALGCSLAGKPDILFLDEPTTGLDPQARRQIWDLVEDHKGEGHTVLLTTHYMDEAEKLCDRIGIIDRGKMIALGSPEELINSLGGNHVIEWNHQASSPISDDAFQKLRGAVSFSRSPKGFSLTVSHVNQTLPELMTFLHQHGAELMHLSTHQATLEDVMLNLTGRSLRDS